MSAVISTEMSAAERRLPGLEGMAERLRETVVSELGEEAQPLVSILDDVGALTRQLDSGEEDPAPLLAELDRLEDLLDLLHVTGERR